MDQLKKILREILLRSREFFFSHSEIRTKISIKILKIFSISYYTKLLKQSQERQLQKAKMNKEDIKINVQTSAIYDDELLIKIANIFIYKERQLITINEERDLEKIILANDPIYLYDKNPQKYYGDDKEKKFYNDLIAYFTYQEAVPHRFFMNIYNQVFELDDEKKDHHVCAMVIHIVKNIILPRIIEKILKQFSKDSYGLYANNFFRLFNSRWKAFRHLIRYIDELSQRHQFITVKNHSFETLKFPTIYCELWNTYLVPSVNIFVSHTNKRIIYLILLARNKEKNPDNVFQMLPIDMVKVILHYVFLQQVSLLIMNEMNTT